MIARKRRTVLPVVLFALLAVTAGTARWWGRLFFPLPYRTIVNAQARSCGIDPLLISAVIKEESSFDPRAVSRRGARGLMQLMPETGAWIAGRIGEDFQPKCLFEPSVNIRYGTWYLSRLLAEYQGDLTLSLAAYNAGSNRVRDWLAKGTWNGDLATLDRLPYPETRRYVMKIIRSYRIYRYLYRGEAGGTMAAGIWTGGKIFG